MTRARLALIFGGLSAVWTASTSFFAAYQPTDRATVAVVIVGSVGVGLTTAVAFLRGAPD